MQQLKPDLGVFLLVVGRLGKQLRDLHKAVLLVLRSIIRVLVAGLGFTGKCGGKVCWPAFWFLPNS